MDTTTEEEKIILASRGGLERSITLRGFAKDNYEKMIAAMTTGAYYVKADEGKLTAIPAFEELPKPAEDERMIPFWRKPINLPVPAVLEEYEHSKEKGRSPSISIQHLCGHNYTPEKYKQEAEKLESYGFECMRSRRDKDGKFWEKWYIPGLWAAKGELKKEIQRGKNDDEELTIALEFFRYKVSFGSLDVSCQRLAMASPD